MKYQFVCQEHEEFGHPGWRQIDQPDFDPLSGMAVAHDILEHFPGGTGSPADEIQALGAMFVVRGEDYFCQKGQRITSPALNAAAEFRDITAHVRYEDMALPDPPPFRRVGEERGWVEEFLREADKLADSEFEEDDREQIHKLLPRFEGWLYRGIRRAKRRYRNASRDEILWTFQQIEEQADKHLKHANIGDILTVKVVRGKVTTRLSYPQ